MKIVILAFLFDILLLYNINSDNKNGNFIGDKKSSFTSWDYNIKYNDKTILGKIDFVNNQTTIIDFKIDNIKYYCKLNITSPIGYSTWDISGFFGNNEFKGKIIFKNSGYEMNLEFNDNKKISGKINYNFTTPNYSFEYFDKKMEGVINPKFDSLVFKFKFDNKVAEGVEKLLTVGSSSNYNLNIDNYDNDELFILLFFDIFHSINIILWH